MLAKNVDRFEDSLEEAVLNRQKRGFRFDNTDYWKKYYLRKFVTRSFCREKRYAEFIAKMTAPGAKVLDLATGYGFLPLEIQKQGLDVTCTDYYARMMRLAKEYFELNGETLRIFKADAVDLPFKDKSFDVVTAMSIVEHFPLEEIKEDLLPEIKRVVKNSGFVLFHMPVKSIATKIKKLIRQGIIGDLPDWAIDDDGDVTHKVWLGAREYYDLFRQSPFTMIYVSFNFVRSNEKMLFLIGAEKLLDKLFGHFYLLAGGKWNWKVQILSRIATSVVFICQI